MANILIIQIVAIIFVLFALSRVVLRFKDKKIELRETIFWILLWISVGVIVIDPSTMSYLATILGVGRGVDVIIYFALILLFYLNFRAYVKSEKTDQDITKIVKEIALKKKK